MIRVHLLKRRERKPLGRERREALRHYQLESLLLSYPRGFYGSSGEEALCVELPASVGMKFLFFFFFFCGEGCKKLIIGGQLNWLGDWW